MNAYRFGSCFLSVLRRELVVDGQPVELQPLVFDMLLYLVQNADQVVTKDALLKAVWRSAFVSESVIARAVMKARRAIRDDARDAVMLRTVPRVGYRLHAEVQLVDDEPAQPLRGGLTVTTVDLVILRFNIEPARSSAEVAPRSLPILLQHLLNSQKTHQLMGATVSVSPRRAGSGVDELAEACAECGAQRALACELTLQPALCRLTARLGRNQDDALAFVHTGASGEEVVLALAASIARHFQDAPLPGADPKGLDAGLQARPVVDLEPHPGPPSTDGFWEAQLSRVIELHESGFPGVAVGLLDRCTPNLKPTPTLALLHARLLRFTGQLDRAAAYAQAALDMALKSDSPTYRVEALAEVASTAYRRGEFANAQRIAEEALQVAVTQCSQGVRTASILVTLANVQRESGEPAQAIAWAERAVASAVSLGDKPDEYVARGVLAMCLLVAGRTFRALELATQVASGANRMGLISAEIVAIFVLAGVHDRRCRLTLSLELSRRAHALSVVAGQIQMREVTHANELRGMVKIGLFTQALAELKAIDLRAISSPVNAALFRQAQANALWRSGEREQAVLLQLELAAYFDKRQSRQWAPQVVELALNLLSEGQLDRAKAMLAMLQSRGVQNLTRLAAAIALVEGQRQQCIDLLRAAWREIPMDDVEGIFLAHDLGWLMLEDARPEEVEVLMTQVVDLADDLLPSRILATAFSMLWQNQPLDEDRWRQTIAGVPSLLKHAPHLFEPGYLAGLKTGHARRLPLLIMRACW